MGFRAGFQPRVSFLGDRRALETDGVAGGEGERVAHLKHRENRLMDSSTELKAKLSPAVAAALGDGTNVWMAFLHAAADYGLIDRATTIGELGEITAPDEAQLRLWLGTLGGFGTRKLDHRLPHIATLAGNENAAMIVEEFADYLDFARTHRPVPA